MDKVTPDQLDYLRSSIRDAIAEDRIVCLGCGARFRKLGRHPGNSFARRKCLVRSGIGQSVPPLRRGRGQR